MKCSQMATAATTPILPDSQSLANFLLVWVHTRIPVATFCFNLYTNVAYLFINFYKKIVSCSSFESLGRQFGALAHVLPLTPDKTLQPNT